jgi:phage terminase large subunit
VFEGQFFPEFDSAIHVCRPKDIPSVLTKFVSLDYGFDMLAALLIGVDEHGDLYVLREYCQPDLTLSEAAERVAFLCRDVAVEFAVASPDLWNRRQDSGRSGFEIMQAVPGMPPMSAADNRRVPGWRILREYLTTQNGSPKLIISRNCPTLIRSLPALLCSSEHPEDASGQPHAVTHSPEALRYAVMSRAAAWRAEEVPDRNFRFLSKPREAFPT